MPGRMRPRPPRAAASTIHAPSEHGHATHSRSRWRDWHLSLSLTSAASNLPKPPRSAFPLDTERCGRKQIRRRPRPSTCDVRTPGRFRALVGVMALHTVIGAHDDAVRASIFKSDHTQSTFQILSPQPLAMDEPTMVHGYRYFGPATANLVNATAIWLDGKDLCNPPSRVAGKVVISDGKFQGVSRKYGESTCLLSVAFERLADANAAGYIALAPWPMPGLTSFWHDRWDMRSQLDSLMPLVEVNKGPPNAYRLPPTALRPTSPLTHDSAQLAGVYPQSRRPRGGTGLGQGPDQAQG
mmetsp:Transcript_45765/g.127013  ORF Transcript_45765/g.127013 Transcript_45765/m.127013 type:complete len:297 (-) Transcript_45765:463-1353(-)